MELEKKLEAILFFKNEPVALKELTKLTNAKEGDVKAGLSTLQDNYSNRGIVLSTDGTYYSFGTHQDTSEIIDSIQKEEFSRELGRAGLETLAIILYKGPVTRREIDYIRGVNSSYILRILLIRGLISRSEDSGRGYSYKPTLELLKHLGIAKIEDLPEYGSALGKMDQFVQDVKEEELTEQDG